MDNINDSNAYSTLGPGSKKRGRRDDLGANEHSNFDDNANMGTNVYQQRGITMTSGHKIVSVDREGHRTFKQGSNLFDRAMAKITPTRSKRKDTPVRSVARHI
jgi:hypothetical protein